MVVMQIVKDAAAAPEVLRSAIDQANTLAEEVLDPLKREVESLRKQLSSVEDEARRAVQSALAGGIADSGLVKERLADLESSRSALRTRLAQAEAELSQRTSEHIELDFIHQTIRDFAAVWDHMLKDEKREFLGTLIKEILVHPDRVEVEIYDGRRARAVLDARTQKGETANEVFASGVEWLPLVDLNHRPPD
jgi:chromosome segregation ATPase